jgi:alanine racemase
LNFYRPTWVEISPAAFASNIRRLKSFIGPTVQLLAVLKADAYGHGAVSLAPVAIENGASMIGVSSLEEAVQLRDAGLKAPLLILGGIYPLENFEVALRYNVTPTVASLDAARFLDKIERKMGANIPLHLKVDTGMGRIGVSPEAAKKVLNWLFEHPNLTLAGVYSHFSSADSDPAFTKHQLKLFEDLKDHARRLGFKDTLFHIANSAGLLQFRESHHEMVRPGIALYGAPAKKGPNGPQVSPVLSWQTRVIFLKKVSKGTPISYGRTFVTKKVSEIATLPVGYADGVPRSLSNKGFVLVKGKKKPILGRVTMDHIMVDVTGLHIKIGDPVILIGNQGKEQLTADDWAKWAGTISYEIFCGISKRVPRVVTA